MKQSLILTTIALISALVGAFFYQYWFTPPAHQPDEAGMKLDAVPLTALDGEASVFADWKGDVLVVNFWAPWCAPCRREVPTLIQLQQNYANDRFKILGIAFDGREAVSKFAQDYQINYPLFLAGAGISMYNAALGNPSGALPFTVVLDRDLDIRYQHHGEVTYTDLQTIVEQLM